MQQKQNQYPITANLHAFMDFQKENMSLRLF